MTLDIQERTLSFGVEIVKLCFILYRNYNYKILANQLIRSGSSVGANMEEADGAVSKKDFVNKVSISYKEARETLYWLKIISRSSIFKQQGNIDMLNYLLKEGEEIKRILGAILKKSKMQGNNY